MHLECDNRRLLGISEVCSLDSCPCEAMCLRLIRVSSVWDKRCGSSRKNSLRAGPKVQGDLPSMVQDSRRGISLWDCEGLAFTTEPIFYWEKLEKEWRIRVHSLWVNPKVDTSLIGLFETKALSKSGLQLWTKLWKSTPWWSYVWWRKFRKLRCNPNLVLDQRRSRTWPPPLEITTTMEASCV